MMTTTDYLQFHRRITPPITPPGVTSARPRGYRAKGPKDSAHSQRKKNKENRNKKKKKKNMY
jgi:hypothetical protein